MTSFHIFEPYVADEIQRRNNTDLLTGLNQLGQILYFGAGAPTFTPVDTLGNTCRALYIRTNGGANTTLYVYEGAAWAAK